MMLKVFKLLHQLEKNGIKVSDDICDIFDIRVKKHISNEKYINYNLWTKRKVHQTHLEL